MAKLLLLCDSNYIKNFEKYDGPKVKNLVVRNCQSKQVLMNEMAGVREGIMVIACLDLIAAEAARKSPRSQEKAIELAFNHIVLKSMDILEEAEGKLACGIIAPIFWKDHSEIVKEAIHHVYKVMQKAPVPNLFMTNYATGMKVGSDRVHLVRHAGRKYVALVNDVFKQLDQQKNFGLVEFESATRATSTWAEDTNMDEEEPGFELEPPTSAPSPTRTLSMVSASMLVSGPTGDLPIAPATSLQSRLQMIANPGFLTGANSVPVVPMPGSEHGAFQPPGVCQPYTGPFRVPPPSTQQSSAPGMNHSGLQGLPAAPATWPTMLTPELSSSLARIEQRLGHLEAKSFFDNIMMASLQEESDTEANRAMQNRVTIIGIRIPNLQRMTENEKVPVMRSHVQEFVEQLQNEGQKFEIVFVRHLNRQVRGQNNSVIEVKFATEKQAMDLRANFVKKKKDSTSLESINVTPVVRLSTRVRVEIMHPIAKALQQQDATIDRAFCVQFVPKPIIKIIRKDRSGNELVKHMSFLESVSWLKENNLEKSIDLSKAYTRVGSAFRGTLQQTFVVLQ